MTEEMKLERMSRILDNAIRLQSRSQRVREDAYKRVVESLEKAVSEEERTRKELNEQMRLQSEADEFQRDLRRNIEKQRVLVLQQQILEKEQKKLQDKAQTQILDYSYPDIPVTPYDMKRKYWKDQQSALRTDLERQIQEKDRLKAASTDNERLLDQFRVEMAKLSMEKDLAAQRQKRQYEQSVLVQSWTQHLHTQQLKKNVDRIGQFPLSYFPRGSTYSRDYSLAPLQEVQEAQEKEEFAKEKEPENVKNLLPNIEEDPKKPEAATVHEPEPIPEKNLDSVPLPSLLAPSALAQLVHSQRSRREDDDKQSHISHGRKSMISNLSHSPTRNRPEAVKDRANSVSSRSHFSIIDRLQELSLAEGDIQKEKTRLLRQLNSTRKVTPQPKVTVKTLLQHDSSKQAQTIIEKTSPPSQKAATSRSVKEKAPAPQANVGEFLKSVFA